MLAADERKENFGELPGDYLCRLSQETEKMHDSNSHGPCLHMLHSEKCFWFTDDIHDTFSATLSCNACNPCPTMNASGEFTPVHVMALARKGTRCCVPTRRERGGQDRTCMQ